MGIKITVQSSTVYSDRVYIFIDKLGLKWEDVKYDIIPLISILNDKHKIRQTVLIRHADGDAVRNTRDKYSIQDINNDIIDDDLYLVDIQIYITRI
jgi:hypothetical protein